MPQSSRTFRIFVSSTFSDMKAERNALQEKVFPRLRDLAAAHGCRFQAIDLRWGVSEEAALDQQTMNICLGEIARCQRTSPKPNFLILLGNRYGWRPLPFAIPTDEFEKIIPLVSKEGRALLQEWYCRDDNALPAVYNLLPRSGEFVEYQVWEQVENRLRQIFQVAIENLTLAPDEVLKYAASATEQEIVAGAMQASCAQEHVFGFFRDIEGLPKDESSKDYRDVDPEASQKLADLRSRLRKQLPGNIHEYKSQWLGEGPSLEHLEQLCENVYKDLSQVILSEIGHLEAVDPLEKEISAHDAFSKERARVFIGRTDLRNTIDGYLTNKDRHPLAIWGASGSGKSALMAKVVEQAYEEGKEIICRFIGATPDSSNGRALLISLCKQISRLYDTDESTVPSEYKALVREFPNRLALAKPERPLILFLDALDQLSDADNARGLAWLPAELPPDVCLIVSTAPGRCLQALKTKLPVQNRLEIQPMSLEDGKAILEQWLEQVKRRLQEEQAQYLLGKFKQCALPLYLKLAFEEARLWKSYDLLPELSGDIPSILRDLFGRLSLEANHGSMLISRSLGYLAAGKNGLSEDELLDILSRDTEVLADFQRRSPKSPKVDRLPVVIWSRLYFDLEPYLIERSADGISLFTFYHTTTFNKAVVDAYLSEEDKLQRHQILARYFSEQPLQIDHANEKAPNLRKLSEQPYQQTFAGMRIELLKTIADYWFMETKIDAMGAQALIEDYDRIQSSGLINHFSDDDQVGIRLIHGMLNLSAKIIENNPHELVSQLFGRLQDSGTRIVECLLEQAATKRDTPWLRPLLGGLQKPGEGAELVLAGHTLPIQLVAITHDELHIATSSQDGSLRLWNLQTGEEEFILEENNRISQLEITQDDQYAVALDDTYNLKIWNIQTGRQENTIRTIGYRYEMTPDGKHVLIHQRAQRLGVGGGELRLVNLLTGEVERSIGISNGEILSAISRDGKIIATNARTESTFDRATFRELSTGEIKGSFDYQSWVYRIIGTADGKYLVIQTGQSLGIGEYRFVELASVKEQFTIDLSDWSHLYVTPTGPYHLSWERPQTNENTKRTIRNLSTGEERIFNCDKLRMGNIISPDGSLMVTSADNVYNSTNFRFVDVNTGRSVVKSGISQCWGFTRDGKKVILESSSHSLNIVDVGKLMLEDAATKPNQIIKPLALASDDEYAILGAGVDLKVWNLITRQEEYTIKAFSENIIVSPDGKYIITGFLGLRVWDLNARKERRLANYEPASMVVASDGCHLIIWGWDRGDIRRVVYRVLNLQTGDLEQILEFNGAVRFVISPTGRRFAYTLLDADSVSIWDVASGREERVIRNTDATFPFQVLAFTHNGDKLLIAGEKEDLRKTNYLYVCDLDGKDAGEVVRVEAKNLKPKMLQDRSNQGILVSSLDEKWVVTRSSNNDLMVWNLAQPRLECHLSGHCASLSSNQKQFVFASGSQVGIYDFIRGEVVAAYHADHEVQTVLITKDGKTLIAGDKAGNIHQLQLVARAELAT